AYDTNFFLIPFGKITYVFIFFQNFSIEKLFVLRYKSIYIFLPDITQLPNEIEIFFWCQITNQKRIINKRSGKIFPTVIRMDIYFIDANFTRACLYQIQQ